MVYNDEQRDLLDVFYAVCEGLDRATPGTPAGRAAARRVLGLVVRLGRAGMESEMHALILAAWRLAPDDPYLWLWYGWYWLRRESPEGATWLERAARAAAGDDLDASAAGAVRRAAQKWLDAAATSRSEPGWLTLAAPELKQLGWWSEGTGVQG